MPSSRDGVFSICFNDAKGYNEDAMICVRMSSVEEFGRVGASLKVKVTSATIEMGACE